MKPSGHDTAKHLKSFFENIYLNKNTFEGSKEQIANSLNKDIITKILIIIKKIEEFDPCL